MSSTPAGSRRIQGSRATRWSGAVLFGVLCAMGGASQPLGAQAVRVGAAAPEIDLPTLDGGHVRLSSLRGHPAIVSFWGTWCPPCRAEFPELVRLATTQASTGLVVIGVNGRDQERRTKDVQSFVTEFKVPFPIALDERGRARRTYRLVGLPTTVFIDSAGVIRAIHPGPIDREALDSGVARIVPAP